jgi:hypothetical protein
VCLYFKRFNFASPNFRICFPRGIHVCRRKVERVLVPGGLTISENPFRCGCHLAWLGHWLRRWTRESLQSHNAPVETAMRMNDMVKEATCADAASGARIPIVQLPPEDMSCHASALSDAPNLNKIPVMFVLIHLMTYNWR